MAADARISAWLCAWKRMESACKLIQKHGGEAGIEKVQDRLLAEARVFTDLACAPEDVGIGAGEFLIDEQRRQAEDSARVREALRKVGR